MQKEHRDEWRWIKNGEHCYARRERVKPFKQNGSIYGDGKVFPSVSLSPGTHTMRTERDQ